MNIKQYNKEIKNILENNSITEEGELIQLHPAAIESIIKKLTITEAKKNTEEEKNNIKKSKYYKNKNDLENYIKSVLGNFYFNFYNDIPKIQKQYLFRFIYLSTFLKYDDTKILIKENNNRYRPIKENELMNILNLKKTEYHKTKTELLKNNLIYIDSEKNIHINKNISTVNKIKKSKKEYTRVFKENIQELYTKSEAREHKQLYTFFEMLPYINYNYNIICYNPTEINIQLINPMTLNDIIEKFSTNKQKSKAKKQLLNMKLGDEPVFIMISKYDKDFFIVNPKLFYKGNNKDDLEYIKGLFIV